MGPMTGRGAGYCAGYNMPGYANPMGGRMMGRGMYGGRGYRNQFYATGQPGWMRMGAYPPAPAPMTPEDEQQMLKDQEAWLQEQLDAVRSQMKKEK